MQTWQLQHAKNRFSEVVNQALEQGPQVITRRGTQAVVVLSVEDYQRLCKPKRNLVEFFSDSPLAEAELDLKRSRDRGREIEI
jgi:prevent-host-death family protein